jgi:hypothetical protein
MAEAFDLFRYLLKVKPQILEERLDLFEILFELILWSDFLCHNFLCHGLLLWNNLDSGEAEWPIIAVRCPLP